LNEDNGPDDDVGERNENGAAADAAAPEDDVV
jgi:hypothetical protein